jgi:hypothetical protein
MELWQALLVAFGGNAALLLVIAFLGRSLVGNFLTKDIEKFKADLQVAAVEHQVRFSKLHEKRAQVLADLYKLLVLAARETESFASPMEFAGEPDKKQKLRATISAIANYFTFFDEHRIYIPQQLCVSLEEFARKLRRLSSDFGVYVGIDFPTQRTSEEKQKAWLAAWDSVQSEVPQLRSRLEEEFRRLLGATTI